MSLSSNVSIAYRSNLAAVVELANLSAVVSQNHTISFSDGTEANQCDITWYDQGTVSGGASTNIDLQNLTDSFGVAVVFVKLKALIIENTGTLDLHIGGAASNALASVFGDPTDELVVPAGAKFMVVVPSGGYTVGASSKVLKVAALGSGTATYNIWAVGATA